MEHSRKLLATSVMPIRWGDMDALGHVNNTVYFRYMEQTRVEWLEAMDVLLDGRRDEGIVIVNASCTFLLPLTYPGEVECRMYVDKPGRSSVQTHYELRKVGDDRLYAEGASKMVWVAWASGKSTPLPGRIREALETAP
jgi:acyl-CoA thioester hydrolase